MVIRRAGSTLLAVRLRFSFVDDVARYRVRLNLSEIKVSDAFSEDGSPKLCYEFDDFSCILRLVEDSSDPSLF